jgi:hypothetical protein
MIREKDVMLFFVRTSVTLAVLPESAALSRLNPSGSFAGLDIRRRDSGIKSPRATDVNASGGSSVNEHLIQAERQNSRKAFFLPSGIFSLPSSSSPAYTQFRFPDCHPSASMTALRAYTYAPRTELHANPIRFRSVLITRQMRSQLAPHADIMRFCLCADALPQELLMAYRPGRHAFPIPPRLVLMAHRKRCRLASHAVIMRIRMCADAMPLVRHHPGKPAYVLCTSGTLHGWRVATPPRPPAALPQTAGFAKAKGG